MGPFEDEYPERYDVKPRTFYMGASPGERPSRWSMQKREKKITGNFNVYHLSWTPISNSQSGNVMTFMTNGKKLPRIFLLSDQEQNQGWCPYSYHRWTLFCSDRSGERYHTETSLQKKTNTHTSGYTDSKIHFLPFCKTWFWPLASPWASKYLLICLHFTDEC